MSPRRLTPLPDQAGRRAGAAHCPAGEADARFPAGPLRQIQLSRLHHRPRWGDAGSWRPIIAATPRSRTPSLDLKYGVGLNHMPSARFAANGAWLAVQVMAHNLARWTARIGLGERTVTTKTLRRRVFAWWDGSPARRAASLCISHSAGRGKPSSVAPWPGCKPFRSRPDGQPATDPTSPQSRATPVARVPCCVSSRHPAHRNSRIGP